LYLFLLNVLGAGMHALPLSYWIIYLYNSRGLLGFSFRFWIDFYLIKKVKQFGFLAKLYFYKFISVLPCAVGRLLQGLP
jgi:hypothetical protein